MDATNINMRQRKIIREKLCVEWGEKRKRMRKENVPIKNKPEHQNSKIQ